MATLELATIQTQKPEPAEQSFQGLFVYSFSVFACYLDYPHEKTSITLKTHSFKS